MKFETFWNNLKKDLVQDEFQTLKQKKSFSARYSEGLVEIFPKSTMHERDLSHKEFLRVWNQAKNFNRGEQFVNKNYHDITRNASYILALMKHYLGEEQIE